MLAADRTRARLVAWLCCSPLYGLTLLGGTPTGLTLALPIRWPGDAARGGQIVAGTYPLGGEILAEPEPLGDPAGPSEAWLVEFHGFAWLADLVAVGSAAAREAGRAAIAAWLPVKRDCRNLAWRADIIGARLAAWITHFDAFFARAEESDP